MFCHGKDMIRHSMLYIDDTVEEDIIRHSMLYIDNTVEEDMIR
jgi:hypothetical protein